MQNIYLGLTTVVPTVNVIISDIDGTDTIDAFMKEVVHFRETPSEHYKPINIFFNTGVVGDLMTERVVLYVYAGIPFILSSAERIYGSDEYDPLTDANGGVFISRMASKNCMKAYSLGFVSKNVSTERYAYKYVKENSLFLDENIDSHIVGNAITDGVMKSCGSLFKPGGYLYDVYSADAPTSKMIRKYKDFSHNPVDELNTPENTKEIVLFGGYPEIVKLGVLSSRHGYIYDVWIPNDVNYYAIAKEIFDNHYLPIDIFEFDSNDLYESYALLCKSLSELAKEYNKVENGEDEDSDDGDDESEYDDNPPPDVIALPWEN